MIARDAGWAVLAATGFFVLCAFSVWGEVGLTVPDERPGGVVDQERHDVGDVRVARSGKASRP